MNNWENFAKYVGVQGVMGIMMLIVICIMLILNVPVPGEFFGVFGIVVGFYFGKNGRTYIPGLKTDGSEEEVH